MRSRSTQVPHYAITVRLDTFATTGLVEWSWCRSRYTLGKDRCCEQTSLAFDASQSTHNAAREILHQCVHLSGVYDDSLDCELDGEDESRDPLLRRWSFQFTVYITSDRSRLYDFSVRPTLLDTDALSAQFRAIAEVDRVWLWRMAREYSVDVIHTLMDTVVDNTFELL